MTNNRFALLLTLFAFAARLWRIASSPLRGDEAFDVLFARQPLGEIIYQDRFNQIYPPLYHTLDHFWLALAGQSEFSARFIAFGAGVLLVPLVYKLAQRLLGERGARITAVLTTIHPFLIWHSQDGRMYTLLALFAVWAALCAVRLWDGGAGRRGAWLGYLVASTLGILNHYVAYFSVLAVNVVALVLVWRRDSLSFKPSQFLTPSTADGGTAGARVGAKRRASGLLVHAVMRARGFALTWLAANALVGLVGLVWIALAWTRVSSHTALWIMPASPIEVLARSLLAYSLGTTIEPEVAAPFLIVFGLLALAGLRPLRGWAMVIALLCAVPLAAITAVSFYRPMYDEKFLILIVPFYMMLVVRGLLALGRWQALGSVVVVSGMMLSLFNYELDARFAKAPPWRDLARRVLAEARADDLVIYNFPDPSLLYQMGDALPVILLPAGGAYGATGAVPLPAQATEDALAALAARYERIWLIPQTAPNWDREGVVERWLTRFADRDLEASFGPLRLQRYLTPSAYRRLWTPLGVDFADHIRLLAYRVEPTAIQASGQPTLHLRLYWQATGAVAGNYTVFAHLLDRDGVLRAQQDNPPVAGTSPTSTWAVGAVIVDRYDIILPSDLPAGRYRFEVGLYDADGARLRAGGDDKVIFGAVERQE
ncbi:MAG: glycosyltransferase family 39 protein [Chloroflexi bacterium]|nr:glycosyltransferase family 39 protein [Chloroflexota bacterium]